MDRIITKSLYDFIDRECDNFNELTGYYVDPNDVIYSFFYSTSESFHILNDWDEGEANDPHWNKGLNEHSVIVFLKKIVSSINYG